MTQRFTTGQAFASGDQVTAQKLEDIVEKATPLTALTDDTSTTVSGGQIIVKTATGAANGITLPKIAHQPANTVLVRDANSEGEVSAKAVTDTQILIGDGTGFTAAALSGDVTMTNAGVTSIKDNVALGGVPTAATASASTNTTQIATTEFVTTALTNSVVKVATFEATNFGISSDFTVQLTEQADPSNIASVSSGVITIGVGTYLVRYYGRIQFTQGEIDVQCRINSGSIATFRIDHPNNDSFSFAKDYIHSVSSGTDTVSIFIDEINQFSVMTGKHFGVTITKLS